MFYATEIKGPIPLECEINTVFFTYKARVASDISQTVHRSAIKSTLSEKNSDFGS